jgi:demethylmenaquinone methyltransferase/2-methoxy-6-polyprenyl-1,4-benzoquinol methylase
MTQQQPSVADGSGHMFDKIAARYDLLNRMMSFGLDARWRKALVQSLRIKGSAHVLDVATGTGDVAIEVCKYAPEARVVGLDPSKEMLAVAREKLRKQGLEGRVTCVQGDAQAMPFAEGTFDAACVSFGIRNVPDRVKGLSEMARVTRRGGVVAVLELGEPRDGLLGPLARFHVHTLVPAMGSLLSGKKEYHYLQQSIAAFPQPHVFMTMMTEAGLVDVSYERLSFGAVYLYTGKVS